jgi:predicted Zn-dependent protease
MAADLEELAAQISFEVGKVIARDGQPLPEKKKKA